MLPILHFQVLARLFRRRDIVESKSKFLISSRTCSKANKLIVSICLEYLYFMYISGTKVKCSSILFKLLFILELLYLTQAIKIPKPILFSIQFRHLLYRVFYTNVGMRERVSAARGTPRAGGGGWVRTHKHL